MNVDLIFLFSQQFHPAMKNVGLYRKEIGVRTILNIIGPLTLQNQIGGILSGDPLREAYCDWMCMNVACGLVLLGKAKDWVEGFKMSKLVIEQGKVNQLLDYVSKTNQKG